MNNEDLNIDHFQVVHHWCFKLSFKPHVPCSSVYNAQPQTNTFQEEILPEPCVLTRTVLSLQRTSDFSANCAGLHSLFANHHTIHLFDGLKL